MLEIWSFNFAIQNNKGKFLNDDKYLLEPYDECWKKNLSICCLLLYWVLSNCVTLVRVFSYFVIKITYTSMCEIPTLGISIIYISFIHAIKIPCLVHDHSLHVINGTGYIYIYKKMHTQRRYATCPKKACQK